MFWREVLAVQIDEQYLNEKNKFELNKTGLMAYCMENICLSGRKSDIRLQREKEKTKHKKKKK